MPSASAKEAPGADTSQALPPIRYAWQPGMPIDARFVGGTAAVNDTTVAPNGEPGGTLVVVRFTVVPRTGMPAASDSASRLMPHWSNPTGRAGGTSRAPRAVAPPPGV